MVGRRRGLTLLSALIVLVAISTHAEAAFTSADLAGRWHLYRFSDERFTVMYPGFGTIQVNANGIVTGGTVFDLFEEVPGSLPVPLGSSVIPGTTLAITPDGMITGTIAFGDLAFTITIAEWKMDAGKAFIAGVSLSNLPGHGSPPLREMNLLVKAGGTFTSADVTGTWHFYGYSDNAHEESRFGNPGWDRGTISVGAGGMITGGRVVSSYGDSATVTGGALAINPAGVITGSIRLVVDGDPATHTINVTNAKLDPTRTMIAALGIDFRQTCGFQCAIHTLLGVFFKEAGSLGTNDLQGTWHRYDFQDEPFDDSVGDNPRWHRGTLHVGAGGAITGGELLDSDGESRTVTGGTLSITASGVVAGLVEFSDGDDMTIDEAKMNVGKTAISSVGDHRGYPTLSVFIKAGTIARPPTVTSFTPTSGPVGTVVTISGTNLDGLTDATFPGAAAGITPVSATSIRLTVPEGAMTGRITVGNAAGSATSTTTFKVTPKITSFTPTIVMANGTDQVTISGWNLKLAPANPTVKIGTLTLPAGNLVSASATEVVITLPATAMSGRISVQTSDGTGTSATELIAVRPPTITGFTPASGPVGSTVTINGTNLAALTGASFFDGVEAAFTPVSATSVRLTVPEGALTGRLSVTNPAGEATSGASFKVTPRITGFTPDSVLAVASERVTIMGTHLRTGAPPTVKIGTLALPAANVLSASATEIEIAVPLAARTGRISVTTADGTGLSAASLNIVQPPRITGFSPKSGAAGTLFTITGANFIGTTAVTFPGAQAAFTVLSATSIRATVPQGASSGRIEVTAPGGTTLSMLAGIFRISPRITGFTPDRARANGTDTVTITGWNLESGATPVVKIGSTTVAGSHIVSASATQVVIRVPTTATTGKIGVTTINGTGVSANNLAVIRPPVITSFSPASGAVGAVVTITGTNLSGVDMVSFGDVPDGVASAITVVSATTIRATVPAGAVTGRIRVTNSAGTSLSSPSFKVTPRITGFTPANALVGEPLAINGLNLKTGATNATVKIGTVTALVVSSTDTQILLTVPTGAVTARITVTTTDGTGSSTSDFVVIRRPTITGFTPTSGAVGATVTINGTNLAGLTRATFSDDVSAVITPVSATSARLTVPEGATAGPISGMNAAGSAVSGASFKVAPKITGFTPASARANGADEVTITGFNLAVGDTAPGVKVGTVTATVQSSSATEVVITLPAGTTRGPISVTTADGKATTVAALEIIALPDVAVTSITAPARAESGGPISFTVGIRNGGKGAANDVELRFYLSQDTVLDDADVELPTSLVFPTLNAGGQVTVPVATTVPDGLTPGLYRLIAVADPLRQLDEATVSNNVRAAATATTIE